MKRFLALATCALVAGLVVTSLATGQTTLDRQSPKSLSASLSASTDPHHDSTLPYNFTSSGKLKYFSKRCPKGTTDETYCQCPKGTTDKTYCQCPKGTTDKTYCQCPKGTTDKTYCQSTKKADACKGKVSITFKRGKTIISLQRVSIDSDTCEYESSVTFNDPVRAKGELKVFTRFAGNQILEPENGPTRTVTAGRVKPRRS
jgi:hypothetical protein